MSAVQDPILDRVDKLNVWKSGGERAPHKPLLLLMALGGLARGHDAFPFSEWETKLSELLHEFGPSRRSVHPEYPFWRLQRDGLWEVSATGVLSPRRSNTDPPKSELRRKQAIGRFPNDVERKLQANPALVSEVARRLLSAHFPETLHQDILDAVGLSIEYVRRPRDPNFRERTLVAYAYRCALCGLDLQVGRDRNVVEAAHIKWHQAGGPDTEGNGLALCSIHHKLFDLGAFTFGRDSRVLVSEHVHGTSEVDYVLLRFHGQYMARPMRAGDRPRVKFLAWHRREVFKERPRPLEGTGARD